MRYLLIALVFWGTISCKKNEKVATENKDEQAIEALFKNFYEDYLRLNPVTATSVGDKRYNDQFPNSISEKYREKLRAFYTKYKDELLSFERSELNPQNQTSYDVLLWECDINLEEMKYPLHLTPVNQFYSVPNLMGQLASGKSFHHATVRGSGAASGRVSRLTVKVAITVLRAARSQMICQSTRAPGGGSRPGRAALKRSLVLDPAGLKRMLADAGLQVRYRSRKGDWKKALRQAATMRRGPIRR